jgi:hypothetical protein
MSKYEAWAVALIAGWIILLTASSQAEGRNQNFLHGVAQGLFSSSIVILFIK